VAHDPRAPGGKSDDRFGYGQQPLGRTDETTGDEGIEPPVGQGHDEATTGRPARQRQGQGQERDEPQVPGYPDSPRGPDSQE
jgi:hypothetical protein